MVRAIELLFQGAPPLPPDLQLACGQRNCAGLFDVDFFTSGLGMCAPDVFAFCHDLCFPETLCDGTPARINKTLIGEGLTLSDQPARPVEVSSTRFALLLSKVGDAVG